MRNSLKYSLALVGLGLAAQAMAEITFYERPGFEGRSFTTQQPIGNFERFGFNDRASSVIVNDERWEICENRGYGGHCVVLHRGNYPSLAAMGMDDRVSSARQLSFNERIDDSRWAPPPVTVYDARRRADERLFQADVLAVHAVIGPPQHRCWLEREQVVQETSRPNVGGAVAGALLGGILGHQFGGGSGRDLMTAGGAVAGAAIGSNVNREGEQVTTQDVKHCDVKPANVSPEFWDVTYSFRGLEHHVQMTAPPGRTITVNQAGEPRA